MLLRTEQLTKDYNGFRALDRLDLEIGAGEIFGLLGPNGSGKSTALRLLLGFLRSTSGRAFISGHDCWTHSIEARRQVAYLPGELRLYENMTARQLVGFLSQLRGNSKPSAVDQLAKTFDIDVARPIAHLSSGMKRKVALMQVLLPQTPLLILDEPTNTLDPSMRDELLDQLVSAKKRGQAVLFSSHVLAEVERVCDRVGILQRGRLVHVQNMAELREVKRVRVHFAQEIAASDLDGVREVTAHDHELVFEYTGPLEKLFGWLARITVRDVKIEPLGLAKIYRRFHGMDE
ncbi:MAG: ABC transporter ATP-binding protein [Gemmataceae bacterium]|nr:ABC transporter ATP-binding protein [Gemmataceae bacterium]